MKKQRLIAALLTVTMLLGTVGLLTTPASAVSPGTQVPPVITYATDAGAFLKNIQLSQTAAWNLTVNSTPTADGQTYAVLLRYDLFNTNYNSDGSIGGVNSGTYTTLAPGTANPNYYRYQNETVPQGAANVQKTIFNQNLYNFTQDSHYPLGETSTTYHMRYALIIFDGGTTTQNLSDYTIVDFYINSEGWLQTESYMLRYMQNKYPTGTDTVNNMPGYQIEAWNSDAPVNGTTQPTRLGYTFLGWDSNSHLLNADANTAAAETEKTPQYPKATTGPVKWDPTISTAFGTTAFNKSSDKFYDLYAIWRPDKVEFAREDTSGAALPTVKVKLNASLQYDDVPMLTLPKPRVYETYSQTVSLGVGGTYTTNTSTNKTYNKFSSGEVLDSTGAKLGNLSVYAVGNENAATTGEYGLKVTNDSGDNARTRWVISGTPQKSKNSDLYYLLQVKDNSNNTTDLLVIHFAGVDKARQPVPTKDANTGLESRVGEEDDGQIFGFYSAGPKPVSNYSDALAENGNGYFNKNFAGTTGVNGTGTVTNFYLSQGMVYEYCPIENGVIQTNEALPNKGWREVPMRQDYYTAAARTALADYLVKGATKALKTSEAKAVNTATVGDHALPAGFTGWPESYGWIEFDENLPVIHGLTEGKQYAIRFRANSSADASNVQTITVSKGGAGGGSSAGLLFNLMRGSVWQIPKPQEPEPPTEVDVTTINVTMGAGGTATITNVKEAETTADDGDETEPTEPVSVTINAAGTKNLTVLGQPVTVTVTPAEGFETHTVTVTADEAPLTPAEGVYTLPEKTVTGALALNISLTAPETPPDTPAARAAVLVETDVTDTLFAASPTGTLPDGSALGLGEGETLQLRDPDGAPVDSITFYVSATGSVENTDGGAGLFDTYICTLNETRTALVWSKVVNEAPTSVTSVDLGGTFKSLAAQFGGKATPESFAAITFYDWDGTTVLGSTIVPKGDATEYVNDFVKALQSPDSKDADDSKESYWVDAAGYPLTYKKGYSFLTWLPFDSEHLTHCGLALDGANTRTEFPAPTEEEKQSFSDIQSNLIVKACYRNNSEMAWTATGGTGSLYYTTEIADNNRIGSSNNYSIDVRVMRENAGKGVPRLGQPMLKVTLTTSAGSMINFFSLENTDSTVITIYPSAAVSRVQTNVVDFYNVTNKAGASNKSSNMTENAGTGAGRDGFLWKGTVNMIRDAVMYNNLTLLTKAVLQTQGDLKLDDWGVNNVTARNNMRKAWLWKNAVDGTKEEDASEATLKPQSQWEGLTFGEMEYAIQNNGKLPSQIQS